MSNMHRETLKRANEAISQGDFEGFLIHCTENTVWNFLGDKSIRGKAAVRRWMEDAYRAPPKFNVRQLIAESEFVAALGDIILKDVDGRDTSHSYCDVWRFENGRMAELNAFVVETGRGWLRDDA